MLIREHIEWLPVGQDCLQAKWLISQVFFTYQTHWNLFYLLSMSTFNNFTLFKLLDHSSTPELLHFLTGQDLGHKNLKISQNFMISEFQLSFILWDAKATVQQFKCETWKVIRPHNRPNRALFSPEENWSFIKQIF